MKVITTTTRLLMAVSALAAAPWLETTVHAELFENFNTPGVLDANFNHTATLPYSEADGVGIGGSRGLMVTGTADSGATYKLSSLDFSQTGTILFVSAFFKTAATLGTTGEDRIFECNLTMEPTNIVTGGHTGVGAKVEFVPNTDGFDDIGIEFRRNNADASGGASQTATGFDIKPNTWYKATFTAGNDGPAANIPATMTFDEYNATGTTLVTANVFNHSFSIDFTAPNLLTDVDVWAAFRVRNGTRLIAAIDDFQAGIYTPFQPGDVDKDGDVDMTDFNAIRDNFQKSVTTREQGDLTNDGRVNFKDFRQWKSNFPFTPPPVAASGGAVPEPASAALVVCVCAVAPLVHRIRFRRR